MLYSFVIYFINYDNTGPYNNLHYLDGCYK